MIFTNISISIFPYRRLLVAFSGGLDSTVLLHRLMLFRENISNISLRAIHVNHKINTNSEKWITHCQSICKDWNIPILIENSTLPVDKEFGIEGQARKIRYAIFKRVLLPQEALVTAQHLDDQSETFLLALKRGSGPMGLSGMPARAVFANTQLIRPLLKETRASLLRWAKRYNLCWIEDESNQNDRYDRNFLRLHILPLLLNRWPYFSKTVARSAELCADQENLLNELLENELSKIMSSDSNKTLSIEPMISMSQSKRSALIRRWLAICGSLMPSRMTLNRIWNEVAQARKDASPKLYIHGHVIRRFLGQLWLIIERPSLHDIIVHWPNIYNTLELPQNSGKLLLRTSGGNIQSPLPNQNINIRFSTTKVLHIVGRHGGRKLKKIWQEYNIPPWLRGRIPLLFYGDTLIAAAGIFITQEGWTENGMQLEWKYENI